jgi:hypothetical protein
MKVFHCDSCGSLIFFENVKCVHCGHTLGFLPFPPGKLSALEPGTDGNWRKLSPGLTDQFYRQCANSLQHQVCNWMISITDPNPFCVSCRLNELIPNLSAPGNLERWHKLEIAKRRVIYTIMRLGLPMDELPQENRPALRFKFVEDVAGEPPLPSGHLDGLITINIAEADDAERERRRVNLHEPYRTLLGHLRHETAHYYWDRLIAQSKWLARFRELFGDETADYTAALKQHYQQGSPPDWQLRHVSAYASAHPWEDWAETGAHYFHIIDMVETAASLGITLKLPQPAARSTTIDPRNATAPGTDFGTLLEHWFPLTQAVNSLNRSMGLLDAYPFVLSDKAIEKLHFIHEVVQSTHADRRKARALDAG